MIKSTFMLGLINRSYLEASFQGGREGREGAQRLGRAGSHREGANFITYSPLATTSTAAEGNGTAHGQKCSVFSSGHQNEE